MMLLLQERCSQFPQVVLWHILSLLECSMQGFVVCWFAGQRDKGAVPSRHLQQHPTEWLSMSSLQLQPDL